MVHVSVSWRLNVRIEEIIDKVMEAEVPTSDHDFTPEIARLIIVKYRELLVMAGDEIKALREEKTERVN